MTFGAQILDAITDKIKNPDQIRMNLLKAQEAISKLPGAKFGDDAFPVEHEFAPGLYIRKMTGIKGMIVVTKLHKTTHPFFILKGDLTILTEEGVQRIKAPCCGITKAGTKRIAYFHEDTIFITVHATEETDLTKIEEQVIAKTYDDLPPEVKLEMGIKEREVLV